MSSPRESEIPQFGWKVKLNHVFPERRNQKVKPKLNQLPPLLPLGLRFFLENVKEYFVFNNITSLSRYLFWALNILRNGKRPLMNYFKMKTGKQMYGKLLNLIFTGEKNLNRMEKYWAI